MNRSPSAAAWGHALIFCRFTNEVLTFEVSNADERHLLSNHGTEVVQADSPDLSDPTAAKPLSVCTVTQIKTRSAAKLKEGPAEPRWSTNLQQEHSESSKERPPALVRSWWTAVIPGHWFAVLSTAFVAARPDGRLSVSALFRLRRGRHSLEFFRLSMFLPLFLIIPFSCSYIVSGVAFEESPVD
ncbi:hypothetical protein K458DRAFT_384486 [Lentithecium fluviatile CBS 122367]|uniref:Uncharacterized protein n=1 Tax=Lentithecium fluviatile CBS 122367 TaxID=1168545 RepID=A0A6G1JDU1_9PLEO|nr:hypothetical protein K458DRAFT_384486 [Lentithecium fluviatile CBS 122367]